MENSYPSSMVTYVVGFVMGYLRSRFESKELHSYKQQVKQLEKDRVIVNQIWAKKERDTLNYIEVLKRDNVALRKQISSQHSTIKKLEDHLKHIFEFASEIRQKVTQVNASHDTGQKSFDMYQDVLSNLTEIRYSVGNNVPSTKRRNSRSRSSENINYKKLFFEEKSSTDRLNSQLEMAETELAKARHQVDTLSRENSFLEKQARENTSSQQCDYYKEACDKLSVQNKNLLTSYNDVEGKFMDLSNEHGILKDFNEDLKTVLHGKNSCIMNMQKVLTSFSCINYLLDANYDHQNFLLHTGEQEDFAKCNKFFEGFLETIKSTIQERDSKIRGLISKYQFNDESKHHLEGEEILQSKIHELKLEKESTENKYQNLLCLKEDSDSKYLTLQLEMSEQNSSIGNFTVELKQKQRDLEGVRQDFEAYKIQVSELEQDLRKGYSDLKQSYQMVHEENATVKSENQVLRNNLHDLLTEKDDLVYKYNNLEEELIYTQDQLSQYKNPDLMPSYQEVVKLYEEVKNLVEQTEQREKDSVEKNDALIDEINKVVAENRELKTRPVFKNICSLYDSIHDIQDCVVVNQASLSKDRANLDHQAKFYWKKIHHLEVSNTKLLNMLTSEHGGIGTKHKEVKKKITAEIKVIEDNFLNESGDHNALLKVNQVIQKFEENLHILVHEANDTILTCKKRAFEDHHLSEVSSQLKQLYERLLETLKEENEHLQYCLNTKQSHQHEEGGGRGEDILHSDSYVNAVLHEIEQINRNTKELEARVDRFRGRKDDKEYLDLDHKFLGNVMTIDKIQIHGHEIVREKRKEAIKYANSCMEKLENNLIVD